MRYESKQALMEDIRSEHDALCALLREIPETQHRERGVWGDGWTIVDLLAHLAEWQRMFLGWYSDGVQGRQPQMPSAGYILKLVDELPPKSLLAPEHSHGQGSIR